MEHNPQSVTLDCPVNPLEFITIEFNDIENVGLVMHKNMSDKDNRYNAKLMILKMSLFVEAKEEDDKIKVIDHTATVIKQYLDLSDPQIPPFGFTYGKFIWISPQAIHEYGKEQLLNRLEKKLKKVKEKFLL